jgi:hypothetical protein
METPTPNHHYDYMDTTRHWDPESEEFTGTDALLTAFDNGWSMDKVVECEEHWYNAKRGVTIYHIHLRNGDEVQTMSLVSNPTVRRIIQKNDVTIVRCETSGMA